ncbi:dynein light chain Tctex-type 5-B-like [Lineus longissimus]|uniref:dynein light chain Tctex-type 5-B-like n=1 Tax=Lineus longissimus TaxID=88925 RepID=UPI00315D14A3
MSDVAREKAARLLKKRASNTSMVSSEPLHPVHRVGMMSRRQGTQGGDDDEEVVKARVKEMMVPRYKIICVVHIGQLDGQGCKITSRCLWDQRYDTCSTYEYRNHSLFAVGTVYGVYSE